MEHHSPFRDAVAAWHMEGLVDSAGGGYALEAHGNVALGVALAGTERRASLSRGGNGKAAVFNGGYLVSTADSADHLSISGTEMTLCMRMRDMEGRWDSALLSRLAPLDAIKNVLYSAVLDRFTVGHQESKRIKQGKVLEFLWRTEPLAQRAEEEYLREDPSGYYALFSRNEDFQNGVLRVRVPIDLIGPDAWHDIVVRFKDSHLQLFVDGVLVDEEWPYGALRHFQGPFLIGAACDTGRNMPYWYKGRIDSGFRGLVDHIALWDRALTDGEIEYVSGGEEFVQTRTVEILGDETGTLQYWRPRGYNASVGDTMPFFHNGIFHFFYLLDRKHETCRWGAGGHEIAHVSSSDLIHWNHHRTAIAITWELSIGTGCCVFHNGLYYFFYIDHARRIIFKDSPYRGDNIFVATSANGIDFEKEPEPVIRMDLMKRDDLEQIPDPGWNDINPVVFPDETGSGFYMSVAGYRNYRSGDLRNWTEVHDLNLPKAGCPSYFTWNGWYYLTGGGGYYMSRKPAGVGSGDWIYPEEQNLRDFLRVPQAAAFGDDRVLFVGFVKDSKLPGPGAYGSVAAFREIIQREDGILEMKWPDEMVPAHGDPLRLEFESYGSQVSCINNTVRAKSEAGRSAGAYRNVPADVRITMKIKPVRGVGRYGIIFQDGATRLPCCRLVFEPAERRVRYELGEPPAGMQGEYQNPGIEQVSGLDGPFMLDVIAKDNFIDICIDNKRTLITPVRHTEIRRDSFALFVEKGEVIFESVTTHPLIG